MRDLRSEASELKRDLLSRLESGDDGIELGIAHAKAIDTFLVNHFRASCMDLKIDVAKAPVAMAAVGSFGRGAIALGSDIDLRFLPAKRANDRDIAKLVDAIMYPIWDAGIVVGHQVIDARDVVTLAREDLPTATSLLDLRQITGPEAPSHDLRDLASKKLFGKKRAQEFVRRLEDEANTRHERYGASVHLLEPDVKSGEGGLRDLDALRWAMTVMNFDGASSDSLDAVGLSELLDAEKFLWRIRNRLHAALGRRSDRLTFDAQEMVAVALGYCETSSSDETRGEATERLMQDYYRHARAISQTARRTFERSPAAARKRGRPKAILTGLVACDGELTLTTPIEEDVALTLRVYDRAVRRSTKVSHVTRDAITRATRDEKFCAKLRENAEVRATFVELLCTSRETALAHGSPIRELADVGILLALIPEFLPVTGRVHHDVYHVYTVDVHSVAAVDCLRALVRGDLHAAHPLASRLAAEIARPIPLFLATLIHDMGKGYPDASGSRKHHSERGAELCDVVLPRLGLSADDVADARALVLHHLVMYHLATRRDLSDPATILELARIVRGREGLRDLYLLTLADISTTSPTAMTSWKSRMLEELYLLTDAFLAGSPDHHFDDERIAKISTEAKISWDFDPASLDAFIESMPMRYRLSTSPASMAAHAKAALQLEKSIDVTLTPTPRHGDECELCVVAPDQPGLLARIAAALTANRLEVLAAQVYSRVREVGASTQAVDVFFVRHADGVEGVRRTLARLVSDLENLLSGKLDPHGLIEARTGSRSPWHERKTPAVPVEVVFDERASPHATVIEVFAKDQPGLLFRLAQALADLGLSIVLSKINTEGTKVADVFYVHERGGSKIEGTFRFEEIRSRLLLAVSE